MLRAWSCSCLYLLFSNIRPWLIRPVPSAKKTKEDAAVVPPSAEKRGDSTRTSPARSSSRGQEEHHQEESTLVAPLAPVVPAPGSADEVPRAPGPSIFQALVMMSPPPPAAPLGPNSSAPSVVLEHVFSRMAKLQEDLLGVDPHLVAGCLELVSSWLHSDLAVRASLCQATTVSDKERSRPPPELRPIARRR